MPGGSAILRDSGTKSAIWIPLLLALGFCSYSPATEHSELTRLAENVYARIVSPDSNAVSNAGFVVLDRSVLVFDTHFTPEAGQALLKAIRTITSKPVMYVVNSHGHADHTHGNQVFANAQLIGSRAARREVLEVDLPSLNRTMRITRSQLEKLREGAGKQPDAVQARRMHEQIRTRENYIETMSRLKITAPFVTLDDGLKIQDGKQEVRILYLGKGHTDGDVVLFLPSRKIVFAGDLFFNDAIPNVQDGLILPWMKTLEEMLKLEADRFVPGHGPIGTRNDVERFLRYFEELQSLVKEAIERGDSLEEATRNISMPRKYSSYLFQNFFPANVQKMYAEMKPQMPAAEETLTIDD